MYLVGPSSNSSSSSNSTVIVVLRDHYQPILQTYHLQRMSKLLSHSKFAQKGFNLKL